MKNTKRIIPLFICLAIVFTLSMTAFAEETRSAARPCPQCNTGTAYQHTTSVYQHDESFPCRHSGSGTDVFAVYEVSVVESCNKCSYRYSYSYENHVFKYCTSR